MGREIPRIDSSSLGGITKLMNKQHIRQDIDLFKTEQDFLGRSSKSKRRDISIDPTELFNQEIDNISKEIGIEIIDSNNNPAKEVKSFDNKSVRSSISSKSSNRSIRSRKSNRKYSNHKIKNNNLLMDKNKNYRDSWNSSSSESDSSEYTSSSSTYYGSDYSSQTSRSSGSSGSGSYTSRSSISDSRSGYSSRSTRSSVSSRSSRSSNRSKRRHSKHSYENITDEQYKRDQIRDVMGHMNKGTNYAIDNERIQDDKIVKIEQIDNLKSMLTSSGINISTVGDPTVNSSMEEIDATLRILRLKIDRSKYSNIAEEFILGISELLETFFDGKKSYPLVGNINYTNFRTSMAQRLGRVRGETSQIVGNIIEKNNIGPEARFAMEIGPSFILHPILNSKIPPTQPSLYSEIGRNAVGDIHNKTSYRDPYDELNNL